MINAVRKFFRFYKAEKEISDDIHMKNKFFLERIYIFSLAFGLIAILAEQLIYAGTMNKMVYFYYAFYVAAGIIGIVLCRLKSLKYSAEVFCLIAFFAILLFFLTKKSTTESFFYFIGFTIFIIMLLNLNPIMYMIALISYEILVTLLAVFHIITIDDYFHPILMINLLMVNGIIIYLSFWKRRLLLKKYQTERHIEEEKMKSEELLLNILPKNIMEQLRDTGKVKPEAYDDTTVLFCEIINFKQLAQIMDAKTLVNELNLIYDKFDEIIEENSCVRIKTIGENYMAVCGLPEANPKHAENIVLCAKQILEYIQARNKESSMQVKIRIGINSGRVIAGIVGIKKYIYDVFGDTVNTASRMETLCDEMQIQVSPDTYALIKDKFDFTPKSSTLEVKGKGTLQTYTLNQ